jgi:hypothetical protein
LSKNGNDSDELRKPEKTNCGISLDRDNENSKMAYLGCRLFMK